ncbi:hypothetical protein LCGC14_1207720 [marine sediment metagenome]|uniref:Uncharacterized protein n=1 Tax=marine sediment metagenome TaxID=412755 RepID=A0A0F9NXC2_9ZZZZ
MTNPFHHTREDGSEYRASLPELKAMVPGLADAELNALCAAVCDGEWVCCAERFYGGWQKWNVLFGAWLSFVHCTLTYPYCPTSDWREAGRLLEKYGLIVRPGSIKNVPIRLWFSSSRWQFNKATNTNPCRAITEAAVVTRLTEMIEEKRGRRYFILDF